MSTQGVLPLLLIGGRGEMLKWNDGKDDFWTPRHLQRAPLLSPSLPATESDMKKLP